MPSYQIKQSTTAYPLVFLMVDSSDHVTPKTGLSPTVTLSKAGGSFASPSGAVSEIGSGWYKVAGNATDSGTLGPLALHATGSGADPTDALYEVVAVDPQAASYGSTLFTTAMTESYNTDGAAPTPTQALMLILQRLTEVSVSGTTMTIKKLDGSTTAATLTLDSGTAPTSSTRAS